MAEYIDRAKVDYEFITTRGGGDTITNLYERILDISSADVVERSKIDNALVDMQSMLDQEVLNDNVISDVGQGIAIAMRLLKENIGE